MTNFFEELAMGLAQAAKRPNVVGYNPNSPTHEDFHKSDKVGRILRGGNRAGKSVAGVVESIWRATGRHPYQKTHDVPVAGRIVTVDKDNGIEQIIKPLLSQWTPPSELVNGSWEDSFSSSKKTMTFRNGSVIDIKTHQQDIEAFAGVPRHYTWFDEECPLAIFNECRLRLIDYNGCWFMTMTPVEGQDWIFDRFIVTSNKNVEMFEIDMESNPHLNKEAIKLLNEELTEDEMDVRKKGLFVPKGGLILKKFDYNRHVIDGGKPIPPKWTVYVSIDHGFNNPTAVLWHAVSPQREVVTFKEHYKNKMLIKQHAAKIHEINKELGIKPVLYVGDPSMSQKNAETGNSPAQTYRDNGIPLMLGKKNVQGRIDCMNEYLEWDKWHITRDCPNCIREIRGYSFEIYNSPKIADRNNLRETPKKKNDHCPDSCGYFFNLMPRLGPKPSDRPRHRLSKTVTNPEDFPWEVDPHFFEGGDYTNELSFGEIY